MVRLTLGIVIALLTTAPSASLAACNTVETASGSVGYASDETTRCISSPDGLKIAVSKGGNLWLNDRSDRSDIHVREIDGGTLSWNPTSTGFYTNDNDGSGETSTFRYFDLVANRPQEFDGLRIAAEHQFKVRFHCNGPGAYVNTFGAAWVEHGKVRVVAQNGIHSVGCARRAIDKSDFIGVVGDPISGRVDHVVGAAEIRSLWCTAQQRNAFGYCYAEPASAR